MNIQKEKDKLIFFEREQKEKNIIESLTKLGVSNIPILGSNSNQFQII